MVALKRSQPEEKSELEALRDRIAELQLRERELTEENRRLQAGLDERVRLEEEARQSEQRFRNLVEGSIQGIMIQRKSKALFVNESFARIFGYDSPQELMDMDNLGVLVHPEDWNTMKGYAAARYQHREVPSHYLSRGVKKDGTPIYVETLARIVDWKGEPAIQSTIIDVTEQKRAEEAIRESEERFRSFFDHSPSLIVMKDLESRYQLVNPRHTEWHGISPEDMIGKTTAEVHPKDFAERLIAHDREVLKKGHLVQQVLKFNRPDGSEVTQMTAKFPLRDSKGAMVGLGVVATDITERIRAEEAVRESEERFQNVFDHTPSLILLKDLEGRYRLVNARHQEIFGIPASELIGKTAHDIYAKGNADEFSKIDKEVERSGKTVTWEYDLVRPDGISITMINTKFPVRNGEGKIVGIGTIATDVSDRRKLEAQLRESQKLEAVGQLAGGIAHDFNNLLQIINGYALLVRDRPGDGEKSRKYLQQIIEAGEKAANLTRQLLTYSRKTVMRESSIDLNGLLANLIDMVGRIIGEDIELVFTPDEGMPPVLVDPSMMEQAVLNLCVNARDAMPGGGRLELSTATLKADRRMCDLHGLEQPGQYLLLKVRDTGTGMIPEVRDHIFEPFFTTKEVGKGTGLGLSMVHSIVLQHRGTIDVESEPGQGTTFTLYLPAATDAPEAAKTAPPQETASGKETILVAEDENGVRELLCDLLRSHGYRVLAASDGKEAVDLFRAEKDAIDLVILDVVMPRLKGAEVHDFIQQLRPEVPVVFSTGYSDEVVNTEYLERHGMTLIQKPYRPDNLLHTVRELLDQRD